METLISEKRDLENRLREIHKQEQEKQETKRREANYQAFKKRKPDWVIGLAHCEHTFKDNGWHHPKGYQIGSVSVSGNCGHTYYPTADLTAASHRYFHNVWTDKQKRIFQEKLNKLVHSEIQKIMKDPVCVLEIMGLQSEDWYLERDYPKDKVKEIEAEIRKEQFKILDRYKISTLRKIPRLSHGDHILSDYLKSKKVSRKSPA